MAKINLFRTVEEFYSNFENLSNPDSKEIANFKKKYHDTKEAVELINVKTLEAVASWKITQANVKQETLDNSDIIKIHQKAKLIKNGTLAIQIIAALTTVIALLSIVASSIYLSSILLITGAIATIVTINLSKIKELLGVNAKTPSLQLPTLAFFSKTISLLQNRIQIIRQNRLIKSENFRNFVEKFVAIDGYPIKESALADLNLQAIYIKYKYALKELVEAKDSVIRTAEAL